MCSSCAVVVDGGEQGGELSANCAQTLDGYIAARHSGAVYAYLFFGGVEFQSSFFHKVVDHADFVDVVGGVEPSASFGAVRFDYGEAFFPISERRLGDVQDFGYLVDFVICL